jgi:glycerol uptake facilitator-like aquaporin
MNNSLWKRAVAEALGTALLLAAVVGSGIMGERLAGGNVALALLANTVATGAALAALIVTFSPISGAHFNPAVTLAFAHRRSVLARGPRMWVLKSAAACWVSPALISCSGYRFSLLHIMCVW